jgi:hypothetical protein
MEGEVREVVETIAYDRKERREGLVGRVGDMGRRRSSGALCLLFKVGRGAENNV